MQYQQIKLKVTAAAMNSCSGLLIHFKRVSRSISPVALMHTAHGRQRMEVWIWRWLGLLRVYAFFLTYWRHILHGQMLSHCRACIRTAAVPPIPLAHLILLESLSDISRVKFNRVSKSANRGLTVSSSLMAHRGTVGQVQTKKPSGGGINKII